MYADPHCTVREIPVYAWPAQEFRTTLALVSKKEDVRKKWGVGDHVAICEAVWAYLDEHRSASEELQAIHDAGKPALKEIITKKNNTWFRQGGKNKAQSMVTARQAELESEQL